MALRITTRFIQPSTQAPMRRLLHRSAIDQFAFRWPSAEEAAAASDRRPRSRISSPHHPRYNRHALVISSNLSTAAMPREEEATSSEEIPTAVAAVPKQRQQPRTTTTTTTTTAKRKPVVKRDPLIVTPAAAARIADLIDQHNSSGGRGDGASAVGIRLGTKKRGCNGLSYTLNYAYANHLSENPRDEAMTISLPDSSEDAPRGNGLKVYVEPMALMSVIGTTMDFADDEMSSEFTFTNPNSKGECGCGESFNV